MAILILNDDLSNGHHVADEALRSLVNDCLVTKDRRSHEAMGLWRCERGMGTEPPSVFHVATSFPSYGYDEMVTAMQRSKEGVR